MRNFQKFVDLMINPVELDLKYRVITNQRHPNE